MKKLTKSQLEKLEELSLLKFDPKEVSMVLGEENLDVLIEGTSTILKSRLTKTREYLNKLHKDGIIG